MPSTRRRFLAGVTALSATLSGCNEGSDRTVEETVTPVDVPRTDEEVLQGLLEIESPDVESSVLVTGPHLDAAVGHVERLRDSVEDRRHAYEEADVEQDHVDRTPEAALEHAADRIEEARDAGPSEDALRTLRQVVGELARVDGRLRFLTGELDVDVLRTSIEAERERTAAVVRSVDYRIARPVEDHLPTAATAELTLEEQGRLEEAERMLEDAAGRRDRRRTDEETTEDREPADDADGYPPELLSYVYRQVESHRRHRDDAERYLETATDPDAPSLGAAIDDEFDAIASELARVADGAAGEGRPTAGGSTAAELQSIRRNVADRTAGFRSRLVRYRENGRRLNGLLEGYRRLLEYHAISAAVEQTLPLLDEREFPTERLPEEKRRGVEALERVADGSALQRHFGRRVTGLLESADRYAERDAVGEPELAQGHLLLVGGAEWAERALQRGEALSKSLQAQQS